MRGLRKVRNAAMGAIAVLPNGIPVYPILGAEQDGGEGGEGAGGDGGDGSGKEGEDDKGSEKDGDADGRNAKSDEDSKEVRRLKDENAERRVAAKDAAKRAEAAEEELRQLKNKDKSELEKLQSDHDVLQGKYDKLLAKHQETIISAEALRLSPKLKLAWRDVDDVLGSLARNSEVTVSDEGDISGVEEALKKLAKAKPHWLAASEKDDDKGKDKNNGNNGTASGGNVGTPKGSDRDGSRSALEKKYPSLRR